MDPTTIIDAPLSGFFAAPHTLRFEPNLDGGGGPALDVGAPSPMLDEPPAAPEVTPPPPEAAPAPPVDPYAQRFDQFGNALQSLQGRLDPLLEAFEASQQPQPPEIPGYDPFNPEPYFTAREQALTQQLGSMLDERFGQLQQHIEPMQTVMQQTAAREGETYAREQFTKIAEQIGDFDQEEALERLTTLLNEGYDPDESVTYAAQQQRETQMKHFNAGVTAERQRLGLVANADGEPSAAPAHAEPDESEPPEGTSPYRHQARKSLGRLRAVPAA